MKGNRMATPPGRTEGGTGMGRIGSTVLSVVLVLFLLVQGLLFFTTGGERFSEEENRTLADFPVLTAASYADGSFAREFDAYTADRLAFRAEYLALGKRVNLFYYFTAFEDKDSAFEFEGVRTTGFVEDETPDDGEEPPPAEQVEQYSGLFMYRGTLMESFQYSEENGAAYAAAVNRLAEDCGYPETYVVIPPPAYTLYMPEADNKFPGDFDRAFDALSGAVTAARVLDLRQLFADHREEYLYFNTDHHWAARGAYYAYTALARAVGTEPPALADYQSGVREGFLGSLYRAVMNMPQSEQFTQNPDDVEYFFPRHNTETSGFTNQAMTGQADAWLINPEFDEGTNLYNLFLSDLPLTYTHSDIGNGKRVLVVRDSFGMAFVPFLADSFEHIYCVEPRYFNKDVQTFVLGDFFLKNEIDTLVFVNYPLPSLGTFWMTSVSTMEKMMK